ncbi:MAG: ROK family glucokinase [Turicibacter sp.]|nr:ROK family glucokinase [Turicibacter sp.]MBQ1786916.1 ROK family glucokinase [Turicibacter sp.]MEE1237525.1 ROK family glucokinase [Turicibacter sp.]
MKKYVFGIDVGGTTIKCGLFSSKGEMLDSWEIVTNKTDNGDHIISDIAATIQSKCEEKGINMDEVEGVGVGVPGPVDNNGLVKVAVNLGWSNRDVKSELQALVNLPVAVGNDANVAALGELWLGAAAGAKDAIMFTLGTGVGGGVIVDSKVVAGVHGAGGEIGHISVVLEDGNQCNCGKKGCLETVASATGIVRETEKYLAACDEASSLRELAKIEAKDVFDAAKAGDAVGVKMVNQLGRYIGLAAANLAVTTDPQKIIIGGGVSKAGDILIDTIEKHYKEFAFATVRDTQFVLAELGNDAGIVGSAYLAKMA